MGGSVVEVAGDLAREGPEVVTLTPADLADVGEELAAYHARFAPLFARREQRAWAQVYLRGLLTADVPRKNVEAMALRLFGRGSAGGAAGAGAAAHFSHAQLVDL